MYSGFKLRRKIHNMHAPDLLSSNPSDTEMNHNNINILSLLIVMVIIIIICATCNCIQALVKAFFSSFHPVSVSL